ncbi:flagellar hook-associated protein FlgL, partial [Pandoraea sputorum]|uniref:flagellar hook-associated protein FlgL n=1 Tax=Pandoraea sputorum TaxID=93222 RepID=UPI003557B57C
SDDPVGAARVLQLAQQNSMLDQYASNITTINYNAANTETALESIGTALQTISELVIKGGNGAYTDADRISTAEQIKQLQSQLLGLLNSQDANGRYLFSGSDAAQPPYSMNSDGTYSYHGNQTSVGLGVGDGLILPSNTTGWEAFDKGVNTTRTSLTATGATPNDDKFNMS